jgi:uncharacterized zinc-type alcohol dehydrogenase-like protein
MLGPAKNIEIPEPLDSEYRDVAWAIPKEGEKFAPIWINRPNVTDYDVKFEVLYCGICHSDCHIGKNDMGGCWYPFVPGHEFLGKVVEVGAKVTKLKVGDHAGVGCYVDSCDECPSCAEGDIPYCAKGNVLSLNSDKKYKRVGGNKDLRTFGGYSATYVVHETFAFKIPDGLDLSKAAPILCGGITMYDPLRHWGATKEGN